MKATMLYGARDVRFEERPDPTIVQPTDAIIRVSVACVCGSDLWPYRGVQPLNGPTPMGHEYCGIVEEVGREVRTIKRGQFVVGSFATSDNTCPHCRHGYQSSCVQREFMSEAQAPLLRVPLADGTLVATDEVPSDDLLPSLLAASDVLGTGWFAADAADVKPGATVAVVGDGAVGLLGVLSAKQMGAERIIAMSRHATRQALAREFGATDIVDGARRRGRRAHQGADEGRRRRLGARVRGHAGIDEAGDPRHAPGRRRWATSACRTASRSTARRCSSRTCACTAARRRCADTCRTDRPRPEGRDRSRQGLRPHAAARPGGRGLPRDGRAARDQDAAAAVRGW